MQENEQGPEGFMGKEAYHHDKGSHAQRHQCLDALLNSQKALAVAPFNEGAAHHCQGDNLSLMSQIVFDWLDEVFA